MTNYYNDHLNVYKKEKRLSMRQLYEVAKGRFSLDLGGMAIGAVGLLTYILK